MSDQYGTAVGLLAILLTDGIDRPLNRDGNLARRRLLELFGIKAHTNRMVAAEAIEAYLVEQFGSSYDIPPSKIQEALNNTPSFHSGTHFKAVEIVKRLDAGDRLIAYTAGGVSWKSAYVENPSRYEFPDSAAMDYLIFNKRIIPTTCQYEVEGTSVPLYELILNKDFGK